MNADAKELQRFFAKVDRNGPVPAHRPELGPCHVWMASTHGRSAKEGTKYGGFRFRGRVSLAHRVAFFFAHGRWPKPCCLHRCDNPACVNGAHLFEGTQADNALDCETKGRMFHASGDAHWTRISPSRVLRGRANGSAKASEQDVRDIRANYALCRVTQTELSERFGLSQAQISRIVRQEAWT